LRFQSIEEKVIYEKLTLGKVDSSTKSESATIQLEQTSDVTEKINEYVGALEQNKVNTSYRPLHSSRKMLARPVTFIKRVIRRLVFWYVEPVCQQQTTFNDATTQSIGYMIEQLCDLRMENKRLLIRTEQQAEAQADFEEQQAQAQADFEEQQARAQANFEELQARAQVNFEELQVSAQEAYFDILQAKLRESLELSMQLKCGQNEKNYSELKDILKVESDQIIDLQIKLERLNKLELDLFTSDTQKKFEQLKIRGILTDNFVSYESSSFAQTGEDLIISLAFGLFGIPITEVYYLDLGACHPINCSNTYRFYSQGARGVLVEANPALIADLKLYRNGDVVLNKCISDKKNETIPFYILESPHYSWSTSDKSRADELQKETTLVSTIDVTSVTIMEIFDRYFSHVPELLCIDIEGKEEEILCSIDFEKCRPAVIVCEMIPFKTHLFRTIGYKNEGIMRIMTEKDYSEFAFTGVNSIFVDNRRLETL